MLTKNEMMRKIIHLSSIFVIFFDYFVGHEIAVFSLFFMMMVYSVSELLRVNGFHFPLISNVTEYCSYSFERKNFVYSPLIFGISILVLLVFLPRTYVYVGIVTLGLGDGIAGLVGRKYGKINIFYNRGKSLEGSLSMFFVVFLSSFLLIQDIFISLTTSLIATFVESLSNEAVDNLTVPFSVILVMKLIEKFL